MKVAINIDTFCYDSIGKYEIFAGTHMLYSRLLWWQNFVWWCPIFLYPQYLIGNLSPFWNLKFWDGCHISRKFTHPWIYILLLYFTRTSCFYIGYVIKKIGVCSYSYVCYSSAIVVCHTQKKSLMCPEP